MQSSALIERRRYAFREKRSAGSPMLKVKLVAKVRPAIGRGRRRLG
jgi:hypothetical protein